MKELVFKIVNRYIDPPKSLRTNELQAWLNGYARCQSDVLDMIDNLEKKKDQSINTREEDDSFADA